MSFTSWLRNVRSALSPIRMDRKHRRRQLLKTATHRPRLELLEDRCTPTTYSLTNLGSLGGGYGANAYYNATAADINTSGQVVGTSFNANEDEHAALWQNGVATDLGTLGGPWSMALGINASGQVVGAAWLSDYHCHAFLITPLDSDNDGIPDTWNRDADQNGSNDLMRDLGTLGGSRSVAAGINASGQVVGYVWDAMGKSRAFLWSSDAMTELGALPDDTSWSAAAINGGGSVTGYENLGTMPPFLWTPDEPQGSTGTMTSLGTLGGVGGFASDLNDAGQVVGIADTADAYYHAFLAQGGVMQDLGTLPALSDGSEARGINNAGQVVGASWSHEDFYYDDGQGGYYETVYFHRATLWQNGTVADLNRLVASYSSSYPWGGLEVAQAINDAGQIVANGSGHAYLLTPSSRLNSLVVSDLPASAAAGDSVSFTVTALSDSGTTLNDYTGTVSLSSSDWHAELSEQSYTFTAADQGVHTFTATLKTAGWQTLSVADATYGGMTGSQSVEVTAAAVSQITVVGFPSPRSVGTAGGFHVTAKDAFGNGVSSYTGTVSFTSTDPLATLPADYTFTATDAGQHDFSATFWTAGTHSLTATDTANLSITGDQNGIQVDAPRISINDVTYFEANAGFTSFVFTVSLSTASAFPVTVNYTTANGAAMAGSDYQAASGTLTLPAGQTTGTITVLVNGDRLAETNETFLVNLSSPTNATIADGQGMATILDDEPRISISDVAKKEGKKGQTTLFTFTVTLSAAYDQAVTMSFRTVNGTAKTSDSDYVARTGTLTFAPGETTKTITIEVKGDSKREADEYFYLDLFGNSGNSLFSKYRGLGTILNDD